MARSSKRSKSRPAKRPARKAAARKAPAKTAAKRAAKPKRKAGAPAGYRAVTPHLVLKGAAEAIEFYKKALGAVEKLRLPSEDGMRLMHAEIQIGDSVIMMSDEFPEWNPGARAPSSLGATTASIMLYVPDVDRAFERAVAAGMNVLMPLADMFWGDRFGKLRDPFGHEWSLSMPVRKVSPAELAAGAKAAAATAKGS
jgi:uncharacterized glyoxalase superfamily protein PhnB